jgi:hypothetical protein
MKSAYKIDGAGDEARTRDIQLGRLKLYQLSYSRINYLRTKYIIAFFNFMCHASKNKYASHVVHIAIFLFPTISYKHSLKMVVGGGFEPPKASPTDLQSVPFDHSGTPPNDSG